MRFRTLPFSSLPHVPDSYHPGAFAFGGPRTESDIMATGLGDALPPYP
jgi:hypothetical protein